MRCSIVIPCHNGADLTRACLRSLLAQTGTHDLEILLVDNASTDDTPELVSLDPRIRVLPQRRNLGFAGGVNRGFEAATHPFCLVLNNDTQAATNLLDELEAVIEEDERIAAVAPVSNHVKGPARLALGGDTRDPATREEVARELATVRDRRLDVDTLAGLCLLLRRSALDAVGTFDERFGHGNYEDDDLCLRLRLLGYRLVIAPGAFLHHEGHATFQSMGLDLRTELRRRREQFAAKWSDDPAGRAVLAALEGDLATAASEARAARAVWPHWPDADWHEGRQLQAVGDYAGAAARFGSLLAACPFHAEGAIELALTHLYAGETRAAQQRLALLGERCHLGEGVLDSLDRRIGRHYYGRGRWRAALDSFGQALAAHPEDGDLHNWVGSCLLELDDPGAAEQAFARAVEHGFPLAWTNLGICAHRRGDLPAARDRFARACEALPGDPVAAANLAALEQQLTAAV